jgi:hypothetical protein
VTQLVKRLISLGALSIGKIEFETSINFDSKFFDEPRVKQEQIDKSIRTEQSKHDKTLQDYNVLKTENSRLSDEVVDLQARSKRDNLLFFGFKEETTADEQKAENCREKNI